MCIIAVFCGFTQLSFFFVFSLTGGDVSLSSSQCSLNAISMVEWADKVLRCVMQAMHDEKNKTAGRQ